MADPWLPILHPIPTPKANVGEYTIFKAPPRLRNAYPGIFQAKTVHLGLQNRTVADLDSVVQDLKVAVADVLHTKLSGHTAAHLAIRSWDDFAFAVTQPNISDFQKKYQECTQGMSDQAVQYHLALDALFLVFYFQFSNDEFIFNEFKILAKQREGTLRSIEVSDFLLLENQVPMDLLKSVMKELCTITSSPGQLVMSNVEDELKKILQQAVVTLLQFSEQAFSNNLFYRLKRWNSRGQATDDGYFTQRLEDAYFQTKLEHHDHILDCVYHFVCGHIDLPYRCDPRQLEHKYLESIPSATQLQNLGIKVKQSSESWDSTSSVKLESSWLHSSHLRLPRVKLHEDTGKEFRNIAIYEQLRGDHNIEKYCGDFRCYLVFMGQLCRTSEDWQLLSHMGVLELQAGNQEVSDLWTESSKGIMQPIPTTPSWAVCYKDIHEHCRSGWKPWRRKNVGIFFGENGWKWLSVGAAVFLLVMTGFQTYFTVVNSRTRKPIWPRSIGPES